MKFKVLLLSFLLVGGCAKSGGSAHRAPKPNRTEVLNPSQAPDEKNGPAVNPSGADVTCTDSRKSKFEFFAAKCTTPAHIQLPNGDGTTSSYMIVENKDFLSFFRTKKPLSFIVSYRYSGSWDEYMLDKKYKVTITFTSMGEPAWVDINGNSHTMECVGI